MKNRNIIIGSKSNPSTRKNKLVIENGAPTINVKGQKVVFEREGENT
jgi:hypothetical protein